MTDKHDLTSTLLPFVDRHLGLPLLSHLSSTGLFAEADIIKAQYEFAKHTSMVDYALQLHEQAYPNQAAPAELEKQRENAIALNDQLGTEVDQVLNVIQDPNVASALKQDKAQNLQWLEENYKLTIDQINALYRYGYFQFSCGNYGEASSYLYHFRVLSTDPALTMSSHWGKLASDILTGEWEQALEELKLLREQLDSSAAHVTSSYNRPSTSSATATSSTDEHTQESLLKKRSWLLHWALFVFFNHPNGREQLVEMFLSPVYLNTIQTSCWWLLRYLVAALVMTRRTTRVYMVQQPTGSSMLRDSGAGPNVSKVSPQQALKDLVRIINLESYRISGKDPIVDFLNKLFIEFDFEAAQQELGQAEKVATNDFFLSDFKDEFVEASRFVVSEAYCKIHQKVDIADLAARLNLSQTEGEKWIVNLIRDTRADAKIDFKEGIVYMNPTPPAIYQNVIEKTRGFTFRTSAMGTAMDRKAHPPLASNAAEIRGGDKGGRGGRGGARGGRGGGRGGARQGGGDRKKDDAGAQPSNGTEAAPAESAAAAAAA